MSRRWRTLLALAGLCILAALLYLAGGSAVLEALRRCTPSAVAGAAAAIIAGTLVGAWNVFCIAGLRATMPFARFIAVYWRSWAIGITLPGQVADMLTTLWQLKGRTGNLSFIAGRLLADKAITFGELLALAALLPWVLDPARMVLSLYLLAALALAALATLLLAHWCAHHPLLLQRWRWTARLQPIMAAAVDLPFNAALLNLALTVVKMLLTGMAYWLVLRAIAPVAPRFSTTTVISQSAGLIAYLPISFNGMGTVEVSAIALFRTVGIGSAVVLSAYLVMRATTLLAAWLPAAWWMLREPAPPAD